jgi:hypothetical protein
MHHSRGRKIFSLNYLLASFFGSAMVAGAFFYYNYEFSKYKFIDFTNNIFYTNSSIFEPTDDRYEVLIYSSNKNNLQTLITKYSTNKTILAVDLYQKRFKQEGSIIHITSGMNTLLKVVQKFNIYEVPSIFTLVRIKNKTYKQDSKVKVLGE